MTARKYEVKLLLSLLLSRGCSLSISAEDLCHPLLRTHPKLFRTEAPSMKQTLSRIKERAFPLFRKRRW